MTTDTNPDQTDPTPTKPWTIRCDCGDQLLVTPIVGRRPYNADDRALHVRTGKWWCRADQEPEPDISIDADGSSPS